MLWTANNIDASPEHADGSGAADGGEDGHQRGRACAVGFKQAQYTADAVRV